MNSRGKVCQCWVFIAFAATFCAHGYQLPPTSTSMKLHRHIRHLAASSTHRPSLHLCSSNFEAKGAPSSKQRRKFIDQSSAIASLLLPLPLAPAIASDEAAPGPSEPYTRAPSPGDKFRFGYTVTPPPSFVASNKPLKTHLDEINFSPPGVRGYTLGVTVDPVRISGIRDFGTPEEVAAPVVTAEVNRDGVFEVTLAKDPKEDASAGCYDIEYISDGKRGTKRFVTRIYVTGGFLYVLTLQSKQAEYDAARELDALKCVKSFRPL